MQDMYLRHATQRGIEQELNIMLVKKSSTPLDNNMLWCSGHEDHYDGYVWESLMQHRDDNKTKTKLKLRKSINEMKGSIII